MYEAGDHVMVDRGQVAGARAVVVEPGKISVKVYLIDDMEELTVDVDATNLARVNPDEELDFDTVEVLGLDGTGRDWNPFHPFTFGNVKQGIAWVCENGWKI